MSQPPIQTGCCGGARLEKAEKNEESSKRSDPVNKVDESRPKKKKHDDFSADYISFSVGGVNLFSSFASLIKILNKMLKFTWQRRRRRERSSRIGIRFCLFILLLIKLYTYQQATVQAQFTSSEDKYNNNPVQHPPVAFFNEPQPLVYMALHESGSGDGYAHSTGSSYSDSTQVSSSISPSLITAKCWNNFEADNDCKQINVITGNTEQQQNKLEEEDSIITPVVIFEASTIVESTSPSDPVFFAPPYFSSTSKPNSVNVLSRHRNPPTANDIYSAPPAGATLLKAKNENHDGTTPANHVIPTMTAVSGQNQPVTRPTNQLFVATPQPKKPPKTTTMGRKCRDENDEDCDEPDDDDGKGDDNDENDDKASSLSTKSKTNNLYGKETYSSNQDFGSSGNGPLPPDDNEDDGEDDPEESSESSGDTELPPEAVETTKLSSNQLPASSSTTTTTTTTTKQPDASIEVFVHPTLPPTFSSTSTSTTQTDSENDSAQTASDFSNDINATDTYTVKPVFPPSTIQSLEDEQSSKNSLEFDSGTTTTDSRDNNDPNSFLPVPMPSKEGLERKHENSKIEADVGATNSDNLIVSPELTTEISKKHRIKIFDGTSTLSSWLAHPYRTPTPPNSDKNHIYQSLPTISRDNPSKTQSETLSAMLLYASIVILVVTTVIFIIMALTFYKRNLARHQALMAQKANFINGASNTMVGSMSHASQLMANMQQPGLLSTYTPGKGLTMSKVTTSVMKMPEDNIIEEDEGNMLEMDQSKDHIVGSIDEINQRNQGGSSWSTEDPTTSSGSQKTDSQQAQMIDRNQPRNQYPNSLSDGRQNSGSLSESQESQDVNIHQMNDQQQKDQGFLPDRNYPQPIQQHPQYDNQQQQLQPCYGPRMYDGPGSSGQPKSFNSSRSVENLQHDIFAPDQPAAAPLYLMQNQPDPQYFKPPFANCIPNQRALFGPRQMYLPNPNHAINPQSPNRHPNGTYLTERDFQFNSPISPARLALNPLATLSRRHVPGNGLNRNIYSEDSSSLLTASPSLARTSSSSSFAFNSQQFNLSPSLKAKPLVDSSGRVVNDYTQASLGNAGPPVMGRKDHSEAWYV